MIRQKEEGIVQGRPTLIKSTIKAENCDLHIIYVHFAFQPHCDTAARSGDIVVLDTVTKSM